ncbi:deoxyribose-phosphate aldolase [Desulfuromonas versatilis]|uniref:Deoxyribose-phosphate aldolase n=1 Tax=Desulfuromonas versatilis TaxID=2802975 RepID=A0ABM8HV45_9BACT|nr:deoxyribose-phosphate aldolase [Desulfuromonas versatilis]BCR04392.1 deoxyribose-phosphate aldolase [Desulfuromonas versatilis]
MLIPARYIDHTLLKPDATREQILRLCEEAVEHGFASVCIPPVYVPLAAEVLYGSEVAVGTVVGFPLGYVTTAVKLRETAVAVASGAREIDMVIHLGAAREGRLGDVEGEIRRIVEEAGEAQVKVIIECCYLDDPLKQALTGCVAAAGAAYVKTSTGFGSGGATLDDVRLLAGAAAGRIGVKAAGGIRDWAGCRDFLQAGATRIGTSAGITIMQQWQLEQGL